MLPIHLSDTSTCPFCNNEAKKQFTPTTGFIQKFKYLETGKNRLDQGIPFGEVPGDEQYKGIEDPDYTGPTP